MTWAQVNINSLMYCLSLFNITCRVSSGVESQEELILELSRLRGALQSVRHEVEALSSCRGRCSQLESLQETVSY